MRINTQLPLILLGAGLSLFLFKPAKAATNISSCGVLNQTNETYYLTQDITSSGNCLTIGAHGVVLDLNGHTVTYGTASETRRYGIAIPSSSTSRRPWFPDSSIPDSAFVGADNVTIRNGSIVQGGTGTESYAIYAWGTDNMTITNTTTTVNGDDTGNIYFNYSGWATITNNTLNNTSTVVSNRHSGRDVIGFEGGLGYLTISNNVINGGPQYGIRIRQGSAVGPASIFSNTIKNNGKVANPYAIGISLNNAKVYNNVIEPQNGRGIHVAGVTGAEVYNNTITVKEGANPEYSPGWAQGIKLENGKNAKIYNNTVTALAGNGFGHAYALDISHDPSNYVPSNSEIYNNTFTAVTPQTDRTAAAVHLVGVLAANNINIHHNTFRSNNYQVMLDYESASEVLLRSNTFEAPSNPINFNALRFYTGTRASANSIFLDSALGSNNSLLNPSYRTAGAGFSYKVQNYLRVNVKDQNGNAISGAEIVVKDKNGTTVNTDSSNVAGDASLSVTIADVVAKPVVVTNYAPFTVTVGKSGFGSVDQIVNLNTSENWNFILTGSGGSSSQSCLPNWSCQPWSACSASQRSRTCEDTNQCGSILDRPATIQACQQAPDCLENWSCQPWSACTAGQQTRTCADQNSCGTTQNRPSETFNCTAGQAPADTVSPNTQISNAPPSVISSHTAEFEWTGVDDQTQTGDLEFSYKLDNQPWSAWSKLGNVSLKNLRNGQHTLQVRTRDQAGNIDPTPASLNFRVQKEPIIAVAQKQGGSQVRLFNRIGRLLKSFRAYEWRFTGGVSVALGDLGNDGVDEVVTSPGPGRRPEVRIFRRDGSLIGSFLAYSAGMKKGVMVAAGDVDGDGLEEIITAPMAGAGPEIRIYGYRNGKFVEIYRRFNAFDAKFRGGVAVALVDVDGDNRDEIVAAPLSGISTEIRFFKFRGSGFFRTLIGRGVYASNYRNGLSLAQAQINASAAEEILIGPLLGPNALAKVFNRTSQNRLNTINRGFRPYDTRFRGGLSVAAADTDMNGTDEIIVAPASGSDAIVRIFNASSQRVVKIFRAFPSSFRAGVRVATGE
ncbi:hypothetical protein C4546_00175 [Candidatus Parcubacteria bacterium]|jgi:hypothetical protein|nr:MAG: hypothetical protein C4546_00175 [Candidatus Parcubacteria bacterium]